MSKLSRRQRYEAKQKALQAIETTAPPEVIEQAIERAAKEKESLQPRFQVSADKFFRSTLNWLKRAETEEPPYSSNSRARDEWLQKFILLEPHLAGIMSSVASIDSNRGWTLTGGRNQVKRFTRSFHNFTVAGDIRGWRPGVRSMSFQFHGTDMGAIAEIARDGERGPFAGFYSADSSHFLLSGKPDNPIEYFPPYGAAQKWQPSDYIRVTDIGFNAEKFNGLGWCAVSRALELAKVMVAVLLHDQEQLAARAPKGLLLLKGISQAQWETAMETREAQLTAKERQYYGGIEVLASGMEDVGAELVALSTLPADFSMETFTNLTLYGYSLCFGYDAREFWPVSGGALGTATETEVQHRKATNKGAGDFSLAHQEQVQREDICPPTLAFMYDERDVGGELQEIEVNAAVASLVNSLFTSNLNGLPLLAPDPELARQRALQMLAEYSVVPQEWTAFEEDVTATDEEDVEDIEDTSALTGSPEERKRRDKLLSNERIYRACQEFGSEPIVRYGWPKERTIILARSGHSLLERRTHPAYNRPPYLGEASELLERAERLTDRLPAISAPASPYIHEGWAFSDIGVGPDMQSLRLSINPSLSGQALMDDVDAQITQARARVEAQIEARRAREAKTLEAEAERSRQLALIEQTLELMRQMIAAQAEQARALQTPAPAPIIHVSVPPSPPIPAPQVTVHVAPAPPAPPPAQGKRVVRFVKGADDKITGAEIE